ncbi:MAG: hypothetical protein ED555_09515 [Allomuricauda sp.]|nr:MAG: hypothetical protein ED555_09515 [Allomuricauda sp.]
MLVRTNAGLPILGKQWTTYKKLREYHSVGQAAKFEFGLCNITQNIVEIPIFSMNDIILESHFAQ